MYLDISLISILILSCSQYRNIILVTLKRYQSQQVSRRKMRLLSDKLAKIARDELNETPERIQQDLNILRVWIRQQSHLRARTSDEFLIAFLRRCRYSLEETKMRIDNFFSYYHLFPEIMQKRFVTERLLNINRFGINFYPEFPNDNGTAMLITRFGQYDKKRYSLREVFKFISMSIEVVALECDHASVAGICQIFDMSGIKFQTAREKDKLVFKKWFDWTKLCCPLRIKECYIINCNKEIYRWISMSRAMMPWELDYPVYLLKTKEELYNYIPKNCLPEEYGGCNGHIAESVAYMEDMLNSYRDYFYEDANYGTCEKLRSSEVATYEAEFGAQGSFRKLEVD